MLAARRRTTACLSMPSFIDTEPAFHGVICPERYGDWKATHKRLRRWCESGVFARILEALAFDADAEYMWINSTSVRAHQHSAGAKKKTAKIKPSADPAAG